MAVRFPPASLISNAPIPSAPRLVTAGHVAPWPWGLRLPQPRRVAVPLSAEEVAKFWHSFRTFRDLALVGLMLLDGLRSCEALALQLEDRQLTDAQMRVLGKGNKKRVLPLPPEIIDVLEKYLRLERPLTNSSFLFVSLQGRQRGRAMTPAGLRSLFRHHRVRSQVPHANAHRFDTRLPSEHWSHLQVAANESASTCWPWLLT